MLRRAASLLRGRAAWPPRRPVTAAATLARRRPEPEARPRAVDGRGYARMARRMPPTRPDGYSTSDGEADAYGDVEHLEDVEPAAAADGEEDASDGEGWDGFTLDMGAGSIVDNDDEEEEEEEVDK
ncbi:uncharacterized protein LOC125506031 [Triticum urartu]|uniref:Uncharacterized protein n=1 Tax=Triticum urartu TaxID=4572 RepID=A0A8R7UJL7_TRIUA|nr:uncharacterized protein LOC119298049 isoform X2 [Triticum dicoccoides]XP_037431486.1 uncharacterized protein LOC119298049 isoform X2 [Triticum dicoccoides]XP_044385727.1 uncharacterized protein LOC123107896 [Triticum aestivum]XP_044385728.1 uncharacterized protein LOC123107896 [Triticum aestivum]XP_048526871.1 uncharacterized protein LOC125506031 [Triticum urartu]XP_048526872.1 uncharacterized protein LOC125506031 [Triticum urartu]